MYVHLCQQMKKFIGGIFEKHNYPYRGVQQNALAQTKLNYIKNTKLLMNIRNQQEDGKTKKKCKIVKIKTTFTYAYMLYNTMYMWYIM